MAFMRARTLDGWTVAHVATGIALAAFRVPRPVAYLIIIGAEVAEFFLRRVSRVAGFFGETQQNIVADVAFSAAGFELIKALPRA